MSKTDTEAALDASSSLEMLLERRLGASGKGLHEKVSSVEHVLDADLVKKLRFIASVRNQVVHERRPIPDRRGFDTAVGEVLHRLTDGRFSTPQVALAAAQAPAATGGENVEAYFLLPAKIGILAGRWHSAIDTYSPAVLAVLLGAYGAFDGYGDNGVGGSILWGGLYGLGGFLAGVLLAARVFAAVVYVIAIGVPVGLLAWVIYFLWGVKL